MTNIKDVAAAASVSIMTVSRVINGTGPVSPETKKRVNAAIRSLDYIPNQLARGLANSFSKTIGVLFSNICNPQYASILVGIERRAKELNYNIVISGVTDYDSAVRGLDMLLSKMVDGLILLPIEPAGINAAEAQKKADGDVSRFYGHLKQTLSLRRLPCAAVDAHLKIDTVLGVRHDYVKAAQTAMDYLLQTGYRSIFHINNILQQGVWRDSLQVYLEAMKYQGLETRVDFCENSTQSAYNTVEALLQKGVRPEVFYCASDIIAVGAGQAVTAFGFRIPRDVGIMGNDGTDIGEMLVPPLTTVSLQSDTLGAECMSGCAKLIAQRAEGAAFPAEPIYIQPRLCIRKSTRLD